MTGFTWLASMKGRPQRNGDPVLTGRRVHLVLASMKGRPQRNGDHPAWTQQPPSTGLDEGPSPEERRLRPAAGWAAAAVVDASMKGRPQRNGDPGVADGLAGDLGALMKGRPQRNGDPAWAPPGGRHEASMKGRPQRNGDR